MPGSPAPHEYPRPPRPARAAYAPPTSAPGFSSFCVPTVSPPVTRYQKHMQRHPVCKDTRYPQSRDRRCLSSVITLPPPTRQGAVQDPHVPFLIRSPLSLSLAWAPLSRFPPHAGSAVHPLTVFHFLDPPLIPPPPLPSSRPQMKFSPGDGTAQHARNVHDDQRREHQHHPLPTRPSETTTPIRTISRAVRPLMNGSTSRMPPPPSGASSATGMECYW